jgi:hypothetical protein
MKRVAALLFALSVAALPAAARDLPRPISPIDRTARVGHLHPSLSETKADKTRKGRPWKAFAINPTWHLHPSLVRN